jgi:hypothetical protein
MLTDSHVSKENDKFAIILRDFIVKGKEHYWIVIAVPWKIFTHQ